jgi:hypothetical protein
VQKRITYEQLLRRQHVEEGLLKLKEEEQNIKYKSEKVTGRFKYGKIEE